MLSNSPCRSSLEPEFATTTVIETKNKLPANSNCIFHFQHLVNYINLFKMELYSNIIIFYQQVYI